MASTLDGASAPDRVLDKGHGTGALGPSDTSDTGSDITGGPGLVEGDAIGLDQGTHEDPERGANATAGSTIGDTDLDSDSDSVGTGERKAVGREPRTRANSDRGPDHLEGMPTGTVPGGRNSSGLAADLGGGTTGGGRTPSGGGNV
jgi:hypothetical protein